MKTSRTSRLNGEYQKEISQIIRTLKDRAPDFKGLVSVTEADVAPDLKTAKIYKEKGVVPCLNGMFISCAL
jgi:ribosome-binding factor A